MIVGHTLGKKKKECHSMTIKTEPGTLKTNMK